MCMNPCINILSRFILKMIIYLLATNWSDLDSILLTTSFSYTGKYPVMFQSLLSMQRCQPVRSGPYSYRITCWIRQYDQHPISVRFLFLGLILVLFTFLINYKIFLSATFPISYKNTLILINVLWCTLEISI